MSVSEHPLVPIVAARADARYEHIDVQLAVQTSEAANRVQVHPAVRVHEETGREALNRCVQHMVIADVRGHRRAMHRTTVAGAVPAGRD